MVTLWLAACGGGGGGSSEAVVLPPEVPAATGAYQFQQAPDDMAGMGEAYVSQARVSTLAAAPSGYEIEAADTVGGTRPAVDAQGILTWTPGAADAGLRRFNLVVRGSDGTTARLPFVIDVAPWRVMVDATFDQAGGNRCDPTNQYCVTVAANQVVAGGATLHVRLRLIARADGGIALSPSIEGAIARPKITFTAPDVDSLAPESGTGKSSGSSRALRTRALAGADGQFGDVAPLPTLTDYVGSWPGTEIVTNAPALYTRASVSQVVSAIDPRLSEPYDSKVFGAGKLIPRQVERHVGRLSGDCGGKLACNESQTPVLLVHGFNLLCNYSGGRETWGRTDEYVHLKTRANVFEFQYRTCMRFEEAAGMLAEAVHAVGQMTKRKPLIVAHSFGGIVASAYLKGLAVRVVSDGPVLADETVPYRNDVAELITVGSPLSGIAKYVGATASGGLLTQGRDTADWITSNTWFGGCGQITCHQAGAEFSDNTNSTRFNEPETAGHYYLAGLRIFGQRGELIVRLRERLYPVPARVLVANGNALPAVDGSSYCDAGDGLIAVAGQAVDPKDFMLSPYQAVGAVPCSQQARDVRMNLASDAAPVSKDPNVTYQFMMSKVRLPRSTVSAGGASDADWTLRFGHTSTHRKFFISGKEIPVNRERLKLAWAEAADMSFNGRLFVSRSALLGVDARDWYYHYVPSLESIFPTEDVIDVGEHPLATAILEVHNRIALNEVLKRVPLYVRGNFSYANAAVKPDVLNPRGADVTVPYTLQIFSKATGQSRARYSGRTDLQGNMAFDYGAWFERLEAVGVDFSQYYMLVTAGDPLECRPTVTRVDSLATDVALGQIKLCSAASSKLVAEGAGNDRDALIAPNGAETWRNRERQSVRWRTDYITGPNVDLYVLHDDPSGLYDKTDPNIGVVINAKLWKRFAGGVPNTGSYVVDPADLAGTGNAYRVLVVSTSDNSKFDLSDANFSLNLGTPTPSVSSVVCKPAPVGGIVACTISGVDLFSTTITTVGVGTDSWVLGGTATERTLSFKVLGAGSLRVWVNSLLAGGPLLGQTELAIGAVGSVPPAVPTDAAPGNDWQLGSLLGGGSLFSWKGSADATEYELVVTDRAAGATVITRRFVATSFLLADLNLTIGGSYQWRIAACNAAGCSSATAPLNFRRGL